MSITALQPRGGGKTSCSKGLQVFTLAEGATHVAQSAKPRRAAFTLAEVLITLGIIGVVAAMTLPALIQNYQRQVYLSQLKKTYAILAQGVSLMKAEYDNVDPLYMPFVERDHQGHQNYINPHLFREEFSKYLPLSKVEQHMEKKFCFKTAGEYNYKNTKGGEFSNNGLANWKNTVFELNNGACVLYVQEPWGSGYDWTTSDKLFIIDVNGSYKGPNTSGKDVFYFNFRPNGQINPLMMDRTPAEYLSTCSADNGFGCAALIMSNGWSYPKNYPVK